jgi:hypothetical protein
MEDRIHHLCTIETSLLKGNPLFYETYNWSGNNTINRGYNVKSRENKYIVLHGCYFSFIKEKRSLDGFIQELIFLFDETDLLTEVVNRKYNWDSTTNFNKQPTFEVVKSDKLRPSVLVNLEEESKKIGVTFDSKERKIVSWDQSHLEKMLNDL